MEFLPWLARAFLSILVFLSLSGENHLVALRVSVNFLEFMRGMIGHVSHRASVQAFLIALLMGILVISLFALDHSRKAGKSIVDHFTSNLSHSPTNSPAAVHLPALELMSRPLASDQTKVPRLLHQSWKDSTLPAKFQEWGDTCRKINPEWEHVLWTDEDNARLVEMHAPWFLDTFQDLKSEIYRADAVRNLYMHVFGGVYADLDTECLLPYDSLFENYSIPTAAHLELTDSHKVNVASTEPERKAFLGKMHNPADPHSGLPNAWMASSPGHPFWILPLESIEENMSKNTMPEFLTGPDALFEVVRTYENKYAYENNSTLDKHCEHSVWSRIHNRALPRKQELLPPQSLELLPNWEVFPYSWGEKAFIEVCGPGNPKFDAETCKDVLGVDQKGSHSISYFSHSWDADKGHSEELELLRKASGKPWQWNSKHPPYR